MVESAGLRKLHVGQPNLGDRKIFDSIVNDIFERKWFTNSGVVEQELEARIADYLGVRNCIAVCNATIGLQLACHALELTGEVIVPAFTFVATAHAVTWEGLKPVFADVCPDTHCMDPRSAELLVTDKTSAILATHLWGNSCNVQHLMKIAERHGLCLFFDAAHAFACGNEEGMVGSFGDCEVFSFHATKFFNTFEGGAITTNNDELASKIRLMKNFGFSGQDNVIHLGTNAKMPEICAAMGLSVFETIDDIIDTNRRNHRLYSELLKGLPGVSLMGFEHLASSNYQYVVIEIDKKACGVSRDAVMGALHAHNVIARRYFYPGCHRMEPYASTLQKTEVKVPETDRLCNTVLCLPTGTAVTRDDIHRVCDVIRGAICVPW